MASDDLIVINYTAPALEGSVIAIECGSLNANSYTSICVEGRWEPNLSQISTRCICGGGMYADRLWVIAIALFSPKRMCDHDHLNLQIY